VFRLFSPDLLDWSVIALEGSATGAPVSYPLPADHPRGFYRLRVFIE
jgi:hypothetical protein